MKSLYSAFALLPLFTLYLGACESGVETSSSTNWFVCENLEDCDRAPGAVACSSGYCVDDDGDRIKKDSTKADDDGDGGSGSVDRGAGGSSTAGSGSGGSSKGGDGSGGESSSSGGESSEGAGGDSSGGAGGQIGQAAVLDGSYLFRNTTSGELTVEAKVAIEGQDAFSGDVDPGEEILLLAPSAESEKLLLPQLVFSELVVTKVGGETLQEDGYELDWYEEGPSFVFAVHERGGETDAGCTADADCAILNVGNGCGYYPQCLNKWSPLPWSDEGGGVCGFPSITHCECAESACEDRFDPERATPN